MNQIFVYAKNYLLAPEFWGKNPISLQLFYYKEEK